MTGNQWAVAIILALDLIGGIYRVTNMVGETSGKTTWRIIALLCTTVLMVWLLHDGKFW